jgi:hypothetical protein
MKHMFRTALPFALVAVLGACAVIPDRAGVESVPPLAQGSLAALQQPVQVGDLVVTPQAVVEDSRCPINARCVWAGRLVVRTRIDGAGWRDTADLTLGEPFGTHGKVIAMTAGEPAPVAGAGGEIGPEDYRFTFEAR